jgi:hypothetical protein|tara:strand:+ start:234 stop:407 length:174 start_codon:yes stop_codon:yes gene_type:complete
LAVSDGEVRGGLRDGGGGARPVQAAFIDMQPAVADVFATFIDMQKVCRDMQIAFTDA